jgi:hypothetical protein
MARPARVNPAEVRRAAKALGLGVVLGVLLGLFAAPGRTPSTRRANA